jgi:hypothetical protein
MSWCFSLFICLSFFFWPELAEYVMVLFTVYMLKIKDKHINSEQHHDRLSQPRPEEK